MDDWGRMSAADLGRGIAAGRIDPMDLAAALLDRARAHPQAAQVFARMTEGRALAEAQAARERQRAGLRRGPLDGVPVSWKDNFDTAGVATEAGSALLAGRLPAADAEVLANATAAGLVCLGKTHMSELAFSGLGVNPITATAPNAVAPGAAPGGSSSGAAASVALGLAAAAVGSDTGGSVRIPAAWQDLVGLKTTAGRVSCRGVVPLVERFDTVGPLCRGVEDAALMLAALEGGRPADLAGATLTGTRIAVLGTSAFDAIETAPAAAFENAADRLARDGARVERIAAPEVAEALALSGVLFTPEAWGIWRETIEAAPERMFPPILDRFRSGAAVSAADFVAAWRHLDRLRAIWAGRAAEWDAVILPTAPILPPDVARLMSEEAYYVRANLLALRNTRIGNLLGLPALTLPTGVPCCGLMILGRAGGEEALLRLGAAAERALS